MTMRDCGDVKDRILEYLAVRKLRAERGIVETNGRDSGAVLTLVGPQVSARPPWSGRGAGPRPKVRSCVAGRCARRESEIKGHRRTYVGALPGRIVRALKDAGTKNPVMMLDEVDKVGADWQATPRARCSRSSIPRRTAFRDHYLDVDLDLSEVLFIATANVAETIVGPLLDRMEVIRSTATPRTRRSRSRADLLPRRSSGTASVPRRSRSPTTRSGAWWATTPGRPASATSSASSGRSCGRSRRS